MKKFWMIAALLLCLAVCVVPVFAEEAEIPPDGGEGVPSMDEPSVDEPSVDEPSMDEPPEEATIWDFEEIKAYINETVLPAAILVLTALGTLYAALLPVINKIKTTNKTFEAASGEIKETAAESQKTKEDMNAALDKLTSSYNLLLTKYDALEASYNAMSQKVAGAMSSMAQVLEANTGKMVDASGKMEKMMIVGFCNNRELMEKGYARKIAEIGAGAEVDMSEIVGMGEKEAGNEQDGIEEAS